MVRPEALNVQVASPAGAVIRTVRVRPRASTICEATVRCQISSYSRNSSERPPRDPARLPGVRNASPDGRMASCASWAFLTFFVYWRGSVGRYSGPYSSRTCALAASRAVLLNVVESVRM